MYVGTWYNNFRHGTVSARGGRRSGRNSQREMRGINQRVRKLLYFTLSL